MAAVFDPEADTEPPLLPDCDEVLLLLLLPAEVLVPELVVVAELLSVEPAVLLLLLPPPPPLLLDAASLLVVAPRLAPWQTPSAGAQSAYNAVGAGADIATVFASECRLRLQTPVCVPPTSVEGCCVATPRCLVSLTVGAGQVVAHHLI